MPQFIINLPTTLIFKNCQNQSYVHSGCSCLFRCHQPNIYIKNTHITNIHQCTVEDLGTGITLCVKWCGTFLTIAFVIILDVVNHRIFKLSSHKLLTVVVVVVVVVVLALALTVAAAAAANPGNEPRSLTRQRWHATATPLSQLHPCLRDRMLRKWSDLLCAFSKLKRFLSCCYKLHMKNKRNSSSGSSAVQYLPNLSLAGICMYRSVPVAIGSVPVLSLAMCDRWGLYRLFHMHGAGPSGLRGGWNPQSLNILSLFAFKVCLLCELLTHMTYDQVIWVPVPTVTAECFWNIALYHNVLYVFVHTCATAAFRIPVTIASAFYLSNMSTRSTTTDDLFCIPG